MSTSPQAHLDHAGSATFRATHREAEMDVVSNLSYGARWNEAVADLVEATRLRRLIGTLAWLDIKTRYRGSLLGPFWLTLSTAVMVATIGVVYPTLFHINAHDYLPYLTLSLVLWGFMLGLVTDGCMCFTFAEGVIRSVRMPFFVFAGQVIVRNVMILGHNIVVIFVVFAIFQVWPGWNGFMAVPAFLLWLIDGFAATVLLGAFCARFRDVPPIVGSVMQIAFYVSAIIWKPDLLKPDQRELLLYNPFYSLFEILRAPLLGQVPSAGAWIASLCFSALLCGLAWAAFVRVRSRIAFWI